MPTPRSKVKVIVTRRLPEPVETRMSELFDVELNANDTPMTIEQLADAASALRRAGADDHRQDRRPHAGPGRGSPAPHRPVRRRRGQYRRAGLRLARHHRHQHARRAHRRHRRHDDGADPRRARAGSSMASPPCSPASSPAGRRPGCSAAASTASASASSAWAASARPSRAARKRLRPADPLSQPQAGPSAGAGRARGDLLGQPRPDAGADGHRLDQLPAHAGDLPPSLAPAASS